MSHQSLEDLVNVSGSPADGKILKYNSGAWGPADESGGGSSSGAEYLELYQWGDSLDRGGMLLDAAGDHVTIIHNSIPSASLFKRADAPSGINYHSSSFQNSTYDDVWWFPKSASDRWLVEVNLLVHYDDTATVCPILEWGFAMSNHGVPSISANAKNPNETAGSALTLSGTEAGLVATGKVETIKGRYFIYASWANNNMAMTPVLKKGRSNAGDVKFPTGSHILPTGSDLAILRRHVRITKVA